MASYGHFYQTLAVRVPYHLVVLARVVVYASSCCMAPMTAVRRLMLFETYMPNMLLES